MLTHDVMVARTLIVGVSVQAVYDGAVACEGTGMTQTVHAVECVCVCFLTTMQVHHDQESLIADLSDLSLLLSACAPPTPPLIPSPHWSSQNLPLLPVLPSIVSAENTRMRNQ